jgi:CheY-like chemotaxis protein
MIARERPLVLPVEDDADTRELYELGLSLLGLSVVAVGDASLALRQACDIQPDIIVTDVSLPEGDGVTLADRVREDARIGSTPVLLLTGWSSGEHHDRVRQAGCAAVLVKPCSPDKLFAHIQRIIAPPSERGTPWVE